MQTAPAIAATLNPFAAAQGDGQGVAPASGLDGLFGGKADDAPSEGAPFSDALGAALAAALLSPPPQAQAQPTSSSTPPSQDGAATSVRPSSTLAGFTAELMTSQDGEMAQAPLAEAEPAQVAALADAAPQSRPMAQPFAPQSGPALAGALAGAGAPAPLQAQSGPVTAATPAAPELSAPAIPAAKAKTTETNAQPAVTPVARTQPSAQSPTLAAVTAAPTARAHQPTADAAPVPSPQTPAPVMATPAAAVPVTQAGQPAPATATLPAASPAALAAEAAASAAASAKATAATSEQASRTAKAKAAASPAEMRQATAAGQAGMTTGQAEPAFATADDAFAAKLPVADDAPRQADSDVEIERPTLAAASHAAEQRAVSAPVVEAPRATPQTVALLAAQIANRVDGKSTRFDVQLDPHGLGKVDVRVEINARGGVSAALTFENPQSAAELRGKAGELQTALEQAGFDLSKTSLSFNSGGQGQQQQGLFDQQQNNSPVWRGRAFTDLSDTPETAPAPVQRRAATGGVDVRI